jgi:acyl-CoA thioesterase
VSSPAAQAPTAGLGDVFRVEPDAGGAFVAVVPDGDGDMGRPFGGHLMGLAIRAAACTVDADVAPVPHAVHARFVRAGTVREPVRMVVDRVHDGRTIAVRRLTAVQGPRTLMTAELSFHAAGEGEQWQADRPSLRLPERAVFSPLVGAATMAPFEVRAERSDPPRGAGVAALGRRQGSSRTTDHPFCSLTPRRPTRVG